MSRSFLLLSYYYYLRSLLLIMLFLITYVYNLIIIDKVPCLISIVYKFLIIYDNLIVLSYFCYQ